MVHSDDLGCRQLLLAAALQMLTDDDAAAVMDHPFEAYCRLLGFSEEQVFRLRLAYLRNELDRRALAASAVHRQRFESKADASAGQQETQWQAWPEKGPLRRA